MSEPWEARRPYEGAARVSALPPRAMIALRGAWADMAPALAPFADAPGQRRASFREGRTLLWMSPDEALLILPEGEREDALGALGAASAEAFLTAADMGHARVAALIEDGAGFPGSAREALAKLTPQDMHQDAFGPGDVRRTRLAQIPAAIWMREGGAIEAIAFRSVADYLWEVLRLAADPAARPGHLAPRG